MRLLRDRALPKGRGGIPRLAAEGGDPLGRAGFSARQGRAARADGDLPGRRTRARNQSEYGLAAAVWTRDISKAHRIAEKLRAGTVWINCYNVFDAALPFGGYKQSGWGREMGHEALELYTEVKAVCAAI